MLNKIYQKKMRCERRYAYYRDLNPHTYLLWTIHRLGASPFYLKNTHTYPTQQ